MSICFIVGAGAFSERFAPDAADLVIAADGGYEHLSRAGIRVDLLLGDFDSIGQVPSGVPIQRHPIEKDDTDMMLAVKTGLQRGFRSFLLFGGTGGRPDHTLANLQTLAYLAEQGARGVLVGGGHAITALKDGRLAFDARFQGFLSVFCLGDRAEGVTLRGLKYTLTDATLTCQVPLGASNEFLGTPASVEVARGTLLVVWAGGLDRLRLL